MLVNLNINKNNGKLSGIPEVTTRGFMTPDEMEAILAGLKPVLEKTVKGSNGNLEKNILQAVKSYLYQEAKRSPYIFVTINKI